jgi:hypothetical protein
LHLQLLPHRVHPGVGVNRRARKLLQPSEEKGKYD